MKKIYLFLFSSMLAVGLVQNLTAQISLTYSFPDTINGRTPGNELTTDGTYLYGMTTNGGTNDLGSIYKVLPDGSGYSKIFDFSGASNGSHPYGGLFYDGTYLCGMTKSGGTSNLGVVFRVLPDGTGFTVVLNFNGANGSAPVGSIFIPISNLYGTTSTGGSGFGTVFKTKPDGTYTNLHSFTGSDGSKPSGSLYYDVVSTYVYGTTAQGGTNGIGTIFRVLYTGTGFEVLHNFSTAEGSFPTGSLITDGTYLYGTCSQGGPSGFGSIFKILPDGTGFQLIHSFTSDITGKNPFGSLVLNGTELLGLTANGGINNAGTVFRIQTDGTGFEKLADFDAASYGENPQGSLLKTGSLYYGTTYSGGTNGFGAIFSLCPPAFSHDTITTCHGYDWHDSTYFANGVYQFDTLNSNGCDSTVFLHLTVTPVDSTEVLQACDSIEWHGMMLDSSGIYSYFVHDVAGCDTNFYLQLSVLSVNDIPLADDTAYVCDNGYATATILNTQTATAYYLRDDTNDTIVGGPVNGTGSLININTDIVSVNSSYNVYAEQYQHGTALEFLNNDYIRFNVSESCTNNFTIEAWVNPTATHEIDVESTTGTAGTSGQKFLLWPKYYYDSHGFAGVGVSVGTNGVSVYEQSLGYCAPLLVWDDTLIGWTHIAVVYINRKPYLYVNDSLVKSGLTSTKMSCYAALGNANENNASQVGGIGGGTYGYYEGRVDNFRIWSVSRSAAQIQSDMSECVPSNTSNLMIQVDFEEGSGMVVNDNTFTPNAGSLVGMNSVTSWVEGMQNCSIGCSQELSEKFNVLINHSTEHTDTVTSCDTYTWKGNTYTSSGTYQFDTTNVSGCDSTMYLNLTITQSTNSMTMYSTCDSFEWNGTTYTSTGTYQYHSVNAAGCDSTAYLDLTIYNSTQSNTYESACEYFVWHDSTYFASGIYQYDTTNAVGCDSTAYLHLDIISHSSANINETACYRYTSPSGLYTWTHSGVYIDTLVSFAGCDSIITINLTIDTVDITVSDNNPTLVANASPATYEWVFCGSYVPVPNSTGQTFTPVANGYFACIITQWGCVDTTACYTVFSVGIVESDFENEISAYPNPTDGKFSIDMGTLQTAINVEIRDADGKLVESNKFSNTRLIELEITNDPGLYFIYLDNGNNRAILKLLKR